MKKIHVSRWSLIIALIAIALVVYIYSQFTFNFGALEILFLLAIFGLPAYYHLTCYKDIMNPYKRTLSIGIIDNRYGVMGAALLLFLGWFCVKTLNNYFYADKHVYRNIDHHVVHFSGISIAQPEGFVLASHNENAFFDNNHNNGQAVITGMNDTAVIVQLTSFSRPIYFNQINSAKRCYRQNLANTASLLSFKENEHLLLHMRNGDVYDFHIGKVTPDSVEYWLRLPNGNEIKSEEDRFLIHGLPLNRLARHPQIQDANFAGIHIVRNVIKPLVKKKEKVEAYKDIRYCVEIQHIEHKAEDNYVEAIKVAEGNNGGGEWHSVTAPTDVTIQIPYETTFVIGYDGNSSRPAYFTRNHPQAQGRLALLYRLPIYHYFEQTPDKSFNNVCVTTSLGSYMNDIDAMPENILLFDAFHHMNNINNIAPITVSYVSGSTNQLMNFLYTTPDNQQHTAHAGECFNGTEAPNHRGVVWIAGIEDLKQTSPYQPTAIKWYIILFTIALAILLFVGTYNINDSSKAAKNTFTTVEFVAYAVTLYLVTFRWFLLWRTSVFLPVEKINYFEFHGIFRNMENYTYLIYTMVVFVIIVTLSKIIICNQPSRIHWSLLKIPPIRWQHGLVYIQIGVTLSLLIVCIILRHSSPCFVISCPVWLFILNTIMITKRYSFYRKDDRGCWDDPQKGDKNHPEQPVMLFVWSLVNALLTNATLLYIDSGFGILFFTFTLFWLSWLLHEHVTHYLPNRKDFLRDLLVLLIFVVMLTLVGCYKNVIRLMYYNVWWGAVVMGIIGAFIGFSVFYILKWNKKSVRMWWCVGLSMTILFSLSSPIFHWYVSSEAKHTAQRIVVHFDQPEVVMKNIEDEQNENRFLQAALNHMIIGEYSRRGEQVKIFGEHGFGYFKMQPHSRVGALWNAQLTDISLVRFVIAEHSPMLPFFIILFFLIMLVWAVGQPLYKRWTRAVLIQIPLLLMVQSLLIWMATTQRFIFLGQDFPMVSINSRLTILYYFSLITIWVITAIYSKVTFAEVYDSRYNNDEKDEIGLARNNFRYVIAKNEMCLIFVVMCMCTFMGYLAPKGKSQPALRMTALMELFCKKIELVNEHLKEYQNQRFNGGYTHSLSNLTSFMQEFNQHEHIDTLFADFPFGYRLWTRYVYEESRTNNTRQVLHACLDSHQQLQLKTVNVFYNRELPQPKENEWRGNIVAISDTIGMVRNSIIENGLCAYRLPASWFNDGEEKTIVSSIGSYIDGSEPDFIMQKGIRSAAIIGRGITIRDRDTMNRLKSVIQEKRYWARNVMLNGHRTMFFPMGASLFWMSQLAEELRIQRNLIDEKRRGNDFNSDVELTLVPDLNSDLYNILSREGATHSSVIVANGDGAVWALPNYDRKYQLNPNDYKQIANIVDSLDLYGLQGGSEARRFFGNQNLTCMLSGPGSSQKPLVWTAVASQVEYAHWDSLRINGYERGWIKHKKPEPGENPKFVIHYFNGQQFRTPPFCPLCSPDENNGQTVTLRGYMTNSSNVYNALMAYIGSFCEMDMNGNGLNIASNYDNQTLFARWNGPLTEDNYVKRFPLLSATSRTPFTLNRKIVSNDQPNSILNQSMYEMFFRCLGDDEFPQDLYSNPAYGLLLSDESNRHMGFTFLERSKFESRQGNTEYELMENAIRSTAIGALKVWYVTPWKMAEAYGRMASLNRNLHLNIVKQKEPLPYESFTRLTSGYWHARPEQMKGMSDVLTIGTGSSVGSKLSIISGGRKASNHVGDYYLYAKTGTIGEGPLNNHHRFGVIISDTDLATATEDEVKSARYVTLYFAFSETGKWQAYADVIRHVMESTEFNQYMKQQNK